MSYVLKQNDVVVIKTLNWNPRTLGKITGTSYPAEVTQDYVWQQDDYILAWEDDPLPLPETAEQAVLRLQSQLNEVEQQALMPRGAREAFIVLCEQQAQAAGLTPAQAYQVNQFYKGLKDTDAICVALRAQIRDLL